MHRSLLETTGSGSATRSPTTLLVVGDRALVRGGLAMLLKAEADLTVLAEVGHDEAGARTSVLGPKVVVVHVAARVARARGGLGRALGQLLGSSRAPPVVVVTDADDDTVLEALTAGARGFVLTDSEPGNLVAAVRSAARQETWIDPRVAGRLVAALAKVPEAVATVSPTVVDRLTAREREVLCLMAVALTNAQIAARLVLSEATVRTHVSRILAKTDVHERAAAVVLAYQSGLVGAYRPESPDSPFGVPTPLGPSYPGRPVHR